MKLNIVNQLKHLCKSKNAHTFLRSIFPYAVAFLIISLTFNVALASIIFSLILTYHIFNKWLDPYVFDSKTTRILLTPFFYLLLLQCLTLFGWLINRDFPLDASAPISFVFLLFFYTYGHFFETKVKMKTFINTDTRINSSDIVSFIVAVAVTLMIIAVPLIEGGVTNKSGFVSLITGNVDDAAHLALLNDRLQFNRGVIYHTNIRGQVRSPSAYPPGWYSANAVVVKAVYPSIQPGSTQSLGAYIVTKVFWFFTLVFVFIKSAFVFLKVFGKKDKASSSGTPWLIASTLLFAVMFLTDFFLYGFYSFFPQLIAIILLAVAMLQINHREKRSNVFSSTLPLLAVLAISGSLTWLLILPAVLLALLVLLLQRWNFVGLSNFRKELQNNIVVYFPVYTLLIGAFYVQYFTYSADKSSVSFMQGILLSGGAPVYSSLLYAFVIVGLVLGMSLIRRETVSRLNGLLALIGSILLLSFFVYIIQIIQIGQTAYYYYKIMSIAMVIIIPISIASYALGLEWLSDKAHVAMPRQTIILATAVFVLLLVPQLTDTQSFRYWAGTRVVSSQLNESIYQQIKNTSNAQDYYNGQYTLYYIPSEGLQSAIGTGLAKASKPSSACFNTANFSVNIRMSLPFDMDAIKRDCAGKYHLTIITDAANINELNNEVKSADLGKTVTISFAQGL